MKTKKLSEYSDRELLKLIVSNQIKMKRDISVIYQNIYEQNPESAEKHLEDLSDIFNDSLDLHDELEIQIDRHLAEGN